MKNFLLVFGIVMLFTSCKKEYTCDCMNPGGKVIYIIKDTKAKAEAKCFEAANFPWSETSCKLY